MVRKRETVEKTQTEKKKIYFYEVFLTLSFARFTDFTTKLHIFNHFTGKCISQ